MVAEMKWAIDCIGHMELKVEMGFDFYLMDDWCANAASSLFLVMDVQGTVTKT